MISLLTTAVQNKLGQLDTHTLTRGNQTAIITSFGGGQTLSYIANDELGKPHEALYQNSAAITDGISAYRGGTQACLFHIGAQKDDMPMHGLLRLATGKLIRTHSDSDTASITFQIDRSCLPQEHQKLWPEDITVEKTIELQGNKLTEKYQITRKEIESDTIREELTIPVMLHNYVNIQPEGIQFRVEGTNPSKQEPYQTTDHTLDNAKQTLDITGINSQFPFGKGRVELTVNKIFQDGVKLLAFIKRTGIQIKLSTTGLKHLKLWTPVGLAIPNLDRSDAHIGIQPTDLIHFPRGNEHQVQSFSQVIELVFTQQKPDTYEV